MGKVSIGFSLFRSHYSLIELYHSRPNQLRYKNIVFKLDVNIITVIFAIISFIIIIIIIIIIITKHNNDRRTRSNAVLCKSFT